MRSKEEIVATISTPSPLSALGIEEWNALAVASYSPTVRERPNKTLVKTKRKTPQNPRKLSKSQSQNRPRNNKN